MQRDDSTRRVGVLDSNSQGTVKRRRWFDGPRTQGEARWFYGWHTIVYAVAAVVSYSDKQWLSTGCGVIAGMCLACFVWVPWEIRAREGWADACDGWRESIDHARWFNERIRRHLDLKELSHD